MELIYKIENGIGILQNPQAIDLSALTEITFSLEKDGVLEINKFKKIKVVDGKCSILIKDIIKGTNTLRLITADNSGKEAKVYPLQPIYIYDVYDKLHCSLAVSLDLQREVENLRSLTIVQQNRIKTLEINTECLEIMKTKMNELIETINTMAERLSELEKNYDPTLI